jgi:hypothetical protein
MAATDTYPLINRLVPGGLDAYLTAARGGGDSHETIAYRLRSEHAIEVSAETVRKWCLRLSPTPSEKAS